MVDLADDPLTSISCSKSAFTCCLATWAFLNASMNHSVEKKKLIAIWCLSSHLIKSDSYVAVSVIKSELHADEGSVQLLPSSQNEGKMVAKISNSPESARTADHAILAAVSSV